MSIYIDVSAAVHRRAGLGRYAESLTRALLQREPDRFALFHNRERGLQPLQGLQWVPTHSVRLGYKPWRMAVWLGQLARIGFDRLLPGAELFHATEHLLMPLHTVPTVLTVHDLIFHLFPQHHKRLNYWYLNLTMPLYCRHAHAIITISESSRRDLTKCYGVPAEKVSVVYEAAAPRFRPVSHEAVAAVRRRYGLPERYVIYVGTIEPRKNLTRLLDTLLLLHERGVGDKLVIVGSKGWLFERFFQRLESMPQKTVFLPGYVPDEDLPALYSGATLAVLPSLYEGFGLPVLEAMACGTPVACSRSSSLPEIGGEAAAYFDPSNTKDMAETMYGVLVDGEQQEEMRTRGLAQAAKFSWSRAAEETMAVYQRVRSHTLLLTDGEIDGW